METRMHSLRQISGQKGTKCSKMVASTDVSVRLCVLLSKSVTRDRYQGERMSICGFMARAFILCEWHVSSASLAPLINEEPATELGIAPRFFH